MMYAYVHLDTLHYGETHTLFPCLEVTMADVDQMHAKQMYIFGCRQSREGFAHVSDDWESIIQLDGETGKVDAKCIREFSCHRCVGVVLMNKQLRGTSICDVVTKKMTCVTSHVTEHDLKYGGEA